MVATRRTRRHRPRPDPLSSTITRTKQHREASLTPNADLDKNKHDTPRPDPHRVPPPLFNPESPMTLLHNVKQLIEADDIPRDELLCSLDKLKCSLAGTYSIL